jgi:hypothetical protein
MFYFFLNTKIAMIVATATPPMIKVFCFLDFEAQKPLFSSFTGSTTSPVTVVAPCGVVKITGFVVFTDTFPTVVVVGFGSGEYNGFDNGLTGFTEYGFAKIV